MYTGIQVYSIPKQVRNREIARKRDRDFRILRTFEYMDGYMDERFG